MCTTATPCKVNASDAQCQYWRGAVCGLVVTSNRFNCGKMGCATIEINRTIASAADVFLETNAFEGKSPDVSLCTKAALHSCVGVDECNALFVPCSQRYA